MKKYHALGCAYCVLSVLVSGILPNDGYSDDRNDSIRKRLHKFEISTSEFMNMIPEKSIAGPETPATLRINPEISSYDLSNAEIDRLEGKRVHHRKKGLSEQSLMTFHLAEPIQEEERAEDLVDELKYKTLDAMDSAHLVSSQLEEHPWSSTYWPIAKGNIAQRYADPSFPGTFNWKENEEYLLDSQNSCSVDQLSPAEKYDLLVGDVRQTLTHAMLKEGRDFYKQYGKVASWMGICHGWAPASYMTQRPAKAIEVVASDGQTKIRLVPSDVKALVSLLWANGDFENRFIGQRCNTKKPTKDENGRITDPECYGENPATWHLSVVNQIGVSRRSFVMNSHHDTDIWNQPVYSYHYSLFNPQTKDPVDSLALAKVSIADFTKDKFKQYRSPKAHSVVGIAMDLTYVAENRPSVSPTDSPENDVLVTVHYLYDLELGKDDKLVGGEWYSNAHPGFLWTPVPDAHPLSAGDAQLANSGIEVEWDGLSGIPSEWSDAIHSSSKEGQPLARIVDALEVLTSL